MPEDVPPAERHFEILNDGTMMGYTLSSGETGHIKVRKVGVRDVAVLAGTMGDELKELAFILDRPQEWVEKLDLDSYSALIEEGRRLNFRHCTAWLKRQMAVVNSVSGSNKAEKMLQEAMQKAVAATQA